MTNQTVGGVVLKVSPGCDKGASVQVIPSSAMQVTVEARTKDGRVAALVLDPLVAVADVTVVHADGTTTTVHVRLAEIGSYPGTGSTAPSAPAAS